MSSPQDYLFPAFQNFVTAGKALTQSFFTFLETQQRPGSSVGAGEFIPGILPLAIKPEDLAALQKQYLERQAKLWDAMLQRREDAPPPAPVVSPPPGDRRFSGDDWQQSPVFDYIRQAYLINAEFVHELVEAVPVEDDKTRGRLRFLARQYADAMAPSNFAATNPEVIRLAVETKGASLTAGINNLIADLERGRISMTDESVFEVGRNLATTPGAVVYENELIQLIQYSPRTDKVASRPLVIVPPFINKFYILDLQAENSFVRYAVEEGNTVFLVSWRNPGEAQGHLTWENYLEQGPIAALEVVRKICRTSQVNALGFCVGGTLLTTALALLRAKGENPVASLTLLTTLLDFSDTGEIGLFVDEGTLATRDATIGNGGLLTAQELQTTFSSLRPNDLVWNYVTNNYLKGEKPAAFDLLYWNADSTGLPGPMACWYLRHCYHDNSLRVPGKLNLLQTPLDLGQVDMPAFVLAAREDHIVPWQTAYESTRILKGETRFVLGASGHIAGVVNPASKNKRSYWSGGDQGGDARTWLNSATETKGSWWSAWSQWLRQYGGASRGARVKLGSAAYPEIEPAPGRYVKERAV